MKGAVSLAYSPQAWPPSTSSTGEPLPICEKHTLGLVIVHRWKGKVRRTIYRCANCGADYTVAEVRK